MDMRVLVRSESEAFRLVVGLVVTGAVSVAVGAIFTAVVGLVVFVAIVVAALAWDLMSMRASRAPLASAARAGRERRAASAATAEPGEASGESSATAPNSDRRRPRILVVADEEPAGDALWEQIQREGHIHPVLDVVAPVLHSRTHFVTTDIDTETEAARGRLRRTLAWAAEHGLEANGVVGDPIAPLARIEDELREHEYVEAIVLTGPEGAGAWLQNDVLKRMREELSVPVTELVGGARGGDARAV